MVTSPPWGAVAVGAAGVGAAAAAACCWPRAQDDDTEDAACDAAFAATVPSGVVPVAAAELKEGEASPPQPDVGASPVAGLLGAELLSGGVAAPTHRYLCGKRYLLLYFSASWCPPCRQFTPLLARFHSDHAEAKGFEVVFVSAEEPDQGAFEAYAAKMPWPAVPYAAHGVRRALAKKYCGDGIPDLCILDVASGEVVARGAVPKVAQDQAAQGFPWPPPTWAECIPETFLKRDGGRASAAGVAGKTVAVYRSAHWCPPCREFTPKLAKFYEAYRAVDPNFEIVFASADRDQAAMASYFRQEHGDWLCIDYDAPQRTRMADLIDLPGIPSLTVFSPDGAVINKNAVSRVAAGVDSVQADGWAPPLLGDLAEGGEAAGCELESTLSVIVRCEGCDDDEQATIHATLAQLAKEAMAAGDGSPDVIFFTSKRPNPAAERIGELTTANGSPRCVAPGNDPLLIALNVPDNGAFFESAATEITLDSVRQFVADITQGEQTRLQLQ